MRSRISLFFLMMAIMGLLLVGCGSGGSSTSPGTAGEARPIPVVALHKPVSASFSDLEYDAAKTQLSEDADTGHHTTEGAVISCHLVNTDDSAVQKLLNVLHSICLDKQLVDARGRKLQSCFAIADQTARLQCLVPALASLSGSLRDLSGALRTVGSSLKAGPCREKLFNSQAADDLGRAAARMAGLLQDEDTTPTQLRVASRNLQTAGSEYDRTPRAAQDMLDLLEDNCRLGA